MKPRRIAIKFFCSEDASGDLDAAIGLFHRLIQQQALEGLLVDVADYIHVPDGPGVILVGHDVEYALDRKGGRPGLVTTAKRLEGVPLAEVLRTTLRRALLAAAAIEADATTGARFDTAAFDVQVFDRLAAPNDAESYAVVEKEVGALLSELPGAAGAALGRECGDDPRQAVTLRASLGNALDAESIVEALGGAQRGTGSATAKPQSPWDISVEELARLRDSSEPLELVDVREPGEFEVSNLGGRLIPLGELADRLGEIDKQARVVVHCKVGGRGAKATQMLREAGFENAWNVNGGIAAWAERIDPSLEVG